MTLKDIKEILKDGVSPKLPIAFIYEDSTFIPKQYISKIAEIKEKDVVYCDTIDEVPYNKAFYMESNSIYVVVQDEFEYGGELSAYTNLVVVCKSFNCTYDNVVNVPKLEPWMIEEYLNVSLCGLDKQYIDFILKVTGNDVNRVQSIIDKFSVFDSAEQQSAFMKSCEAGEFSDVTTYTAFDLSNAITSRNIKAVVDILTDSYVDITTDFGLVALLYKEFKTILTVQTSSKSAAELGINDNRYCAIRKYKIGKYSKEELINILKFLSLFDYKIKSGQLYGVDTFQYIIINVLYARNIDENICCW